MTGWVRRVFLRRNPTMAVSLGYAIKQLTQPTKLRNGIVQVIFARLLGFAVTFGYGVLVCHGTDFHRADIAPSRAHSFPQQWESSSFD